MKKITILLVAMVTCCSVLYAGNRIVSKSSSRGQNDITWYDRVYDVHQYDLETDPNMYYVGNDSANVYYTTDSTYTHPILKGPLTDFATWNSTRQMQNELQKMTPQHYWIYSWPSNFPDSGVILQGSNFIYVAVYGYMNSTHKSAGSFSHRIGKL